MSIAKDYIILTSDLIDLLNAYKRVFSNNGKTMYEAFESEIVSLNSKLNSSSVLTSDQINIVNNCYNKVLSNIR